MTKHPPHAVANQLVQMALVALAPTGHYVAAQEPITLEDSEPEPDVVVVRGAVRNFIQRHPGAEEVDLVGEIADASLRRDRGAQRGVYARAGIPNYWIVNLIDHCIETYSDPTGAGQQATYRRSATRYSDDELSVVIGSVEVGRLAVRDLLP